MKCYAQLFGSQADEYEVFSSLKDMCDLLYWRLKFDPEYFCLESPEFLVFVGTPDGIYPCDACPDYRVYVGPRGGIRKERLS
jgi:hypothetical protein